MIHNTSPNPQGSEPAPAPLLTARAVAVRLAIDVDTVYRLAHRGELPFVRIASCLRFFSADVEALVAQGMVRLK